MVGRALALGAGGLALGAAADGGLVQRGALEAWLGGLDPRRRYDCEPCRMAHAQVCHPCQAEVAGQHCTALRQGAKASSACWWRGRGLWQSTSRRRL